MISLLCMGFLFPNNELFPLCFGFSDRTKMTASENVNRYLLKFDVDQEFEFFFIGDKLSLLFLSPRCLAATSTVKPMGTSVRMYRGTNEKQKIILIYWKRKSNYTVGLGFLFIGKQVVIQNSSKWWNAQGRQFCKTEERVQLQIQRGQTPSQLWKIKNFAIVYSLKIIDRIF